MAVTQVGICNLALTRIGCDSITSITQETKSARLLNAIWDHKRDEFLRKHRWNFATKRATLAPTGADPEFGYDYEYDLPNDCLRVLEPDDSDESIDHVIEDGKLLCDESTLDLSYIYRNTNYAAWDSLAASAFAWELASEIAYSMTQSLALAESCEKKARAVLAEARNADGSEGTMGAVVANTWTDARR